MTLIERAPCLSTSPLLVRSFLRWPPASPTSTARVAPRRRPSFGAAIARTLTGPLSNRGIGVASEQNAEDTIRAFRTALADLLGASPAGIVYGRSATQIAYDFCRHLAKTWAPGDEVVVTQLDHDANVRPWIQAAAAVGVTVRWLRLDPTTAELRLNELDEAVGERTRLVAVTAASNLLGTKPPVNQIARRAHEVGALVYVDGVHYTAHAAVDISAPGADFFACSPYKFLGRTAQPWPPIRRCWKP